ncbi:S8 family peptidase [Arcanobacterium hippocoleae]
MGDRSKHGLALKKSANAVFNSFDSSLLSIDINPELRAAGTVIVLEGEGAIYPLKLDSLNSHTGGRCSKPKWLLLSVRVSEDEEKSEQATVWVSDEYRKKFLELFADYLNDDKNTKTGKPKNQNLVANISRIRKAVLEDLWTSKSKLPGTGKHWWEIWLDATSPHIADWKKFVDLYKLKSRNREFCFGDRLIIWVEATREQLEILLFTSVPVAEIRSPEFIDSVEDLSLDEQTEYVEDLAVRISPAPELAPAVCHLDTGVLRTHILLENSLAIGDHHSIFGGSGTDVYPGGHGTLMAGLALYGNLDSLLTGTMPVLLRHRLESVRMLHGSGESKLNPLDYGTATVEAVTLPEVHCNSRNRVFCLALSTDSDIPGEPSLWSATVDALAVGTDIVRSGNEIQLLSKPNPDAARLFVIAAGNVSEYNDDYQKNCINSPIQNPAQAWNALTVGAYTDLTTPPMHPQYAGWKVVAAAGDISPHTSTSLYFDLKRWPIKPDICMEGEMSLATVQIFLRIGFQIFHCAPLDPAPILLLHQPMPPVLLLRKRHVLLLL